LWLDSFLNVKSASERSDGIRSGADPSEGSIRDLV
jgi:hypothetical protein